MIDVEFRNKLKELLESKYVCYGVKMKGDAGNKIQFVSVMLRMSRMRFYHNSLILIFQIKFLNIKVNSFNFILMFAKKWFEQVCELN